MSRNTPPDASPPDLPGYRFIRNIGAGGNAQVYLYAQDLPKREVAVKVLNESALSEAARSRFTAEANVTAGLPHRHIVQVFDAKVTPDGCPYIVMPYYPQPNLSVRARRSHFSVADVLRIGIQIGSAVETSHRHGVLHRDIKPQNILTDSYGEPALTDFGIATTTGGDGPEGLSVPWSPPEILYGTEAGDQRSDVYSLGATLWHLLAGRSPFELAGGDNTTYALMGRIKSDPVPRTGRADVPDSLERLLRHAMAKDPAARPQTAMELIRSLQSIEQELRLPLTQPILPADGSQDGEASGDTLGRPPAHTGETTFGRGFGRDSGHADPRASGGAAGPGWGAGAGHAGTRTGTGQPPPDASQRQPTWGGGDTQDAGSGTAARAGAWSAMPSGSGAPAAEEDLATRSRGPVRLDPWNTSGSQDDAATRSRGPVRLDPWGGTQARGAPAYGARPRQFPQEAEEAATLARPRQVSPVPDAFGATDAGPFGHAGAGPFGRTEAGGVAGTGRGAGGDSARPRRGLTIAVGGGLLAVVAAVAVFALTQGGAQPAGPQSTQSTQSGGDQGAIGPVGTAPGTPDVTASRVSPTQVKFSWTYANHQAGDVFVWWRASGPGSHAHQLAAKPEVVLPVPRGQSVCVEVQVRRANGTASDQSEPGCWPQ